MNSDSLSSPRPFPRILAIYWGSFLRKLPFNRGKGRLTGFVPLKALAERGQFQDYLFKGKQGIVWDASSLPDIMTTHMFWEGSYQDDVLFCLSLALQKGDVFFDVGAHFGLMSIYASKLVGPTGKVFSFEPNPGTRKILTHHCRLNQCENVTISDKGLMDRSGELEFFMTTDNSWNSTFDVSFADQHLYQKTVVQTETMDEFVKREGVVPQLIKVDTEGTEYECLKGGQETIRTHRPLIITEYNPLSQSRPGEDDKRLLFFLHELGYDLFAPRASFWGNFGKSGFNRIDPEAPYSGDLFNILCVPRDRSDILKKVGA